MKRLLITLDGSPQSEAVLPIAADLARATGAEVHLLRVVELPSGTREHVPPREPMRAGLPDNDAGSMIVVARLSDGMSEELVERRDQAIARLEDETKGYLAQLAANLGVPNVQQHVRFNDSPANAILAAAKELVPDLIAMSTHGRGAVATAIQGSVATAVLRSGVAPVLLVRPGSLR